MNRQSKVLLNLGGRVYKQISDGTFEEISPRENTSRPTKTTKEKKGPDIQFGDIAGGRIITIDIDTRKE